MQTYMNRHSHSLPITINKYLSLSINAGNNPFCIVPARKDEVVSVYADYQHFHEVFQGLNIPDFGNLIELYGTLPDPTGRSTVDDGIDLDTVHAVCCDNGGISSKRCILLLML